MPGGTLTDPVVVERPVCCVDGCRARPAYRDDATGERICGPHLRARRASTS